MGIDADTAAIRLRRMPGVFPVGRVLNAKTGPSQLTGGVIWGGPARPLRKRLWSTRDPAAAGMRVRDFPITIEKVLSGLPPMDV
ncbi:MULTISPECIES: hypothetical protein [Streptomyces]|uniref:Uncharacterized protein n=1 Tax=Streptomyces nigrescens TaxID=1920 RepID=A0ABY7JH53_STRNI|nr:MULTISPECIES: hypothetical protein [Streptomyces]WAU09307.1 hypothetical protein STRNI_008099 [Streptomyces nigrescens]WDT52703.1 hypothetical protein NUT86_00935 [Streptomyces sp. G7(2002)]